MTTIWPIRPTDEIYTVKPNRTSQLVNSDNAKPNFREVVPQTTL